MLVAAAVLAVVDRIHSILVPWLFRSLPLAGFQAIGIAAFAVKLAGVVTLAIGAYLLARGGPVRWLRVAGLLAVVAAAGMAIDALLPLILPDPYADGSWTDRLHTLGMLVPYLLHAAALSCFALGVRVIARRADDGPGDRLAAAATALAALAAISMPPVAWRWLVGSLGDAWGLRLNLAAITAVLVVVIALLRRRLREVPA